MNFEEIIRALNFADYHGPLSVEWEDQNMDREHGAAEAAAFVKRLDFAAQSTIVFDAQFDPVARGWRSGKTVLYLDELVGYSTCHAGAEAPRLSCASSNAPYLAAAVSCWCKGSAGLAAESMPFMEIKKGIGVSSGVVVCQALVLSRKMTCASAGGRFPRRRLRRSGSGCRRRWRLRGRISGSLRDQTARDLGQETGAIFNFHLGLLDDPTLLDTFYQGIEKHAVHGGVCRLAVAARICQAVSEAEG